jgi:hypothetical protein
VKLVAVGQDLRGQGSRRYRITLWCGTMTAWSSCLQARSSRTSTASTG